MRLFKTIIASALAALTLFAVAAPASATSYAANTATATANVNVRSGPGTGFAVVGTLRRGQQVTIDYCRGNWCFVQWRGPTGWVSASYLARGGYAPASPRPPVVVQPPRPPVIVQPPRPPVYYDDYYYEPPVWQRPRPRPPTWHQPRPPRDNSQVCYTSPDGYFCIGN